MQIINVQTTPLKEILATSIKVLKSGGIIIYPTETVYGMGVDALNEVAVKKLLAYKEKREDKPLSIAVADRKMAENYAEINEVANDLYTNFLPGPITVISHGKHKTAKGVESFLGTIGIRIPDNALVRNIIQAFHQPITATSANASYKRRPYTIDDILSTISERQKGLIDLILDAGTLPHNDPSTIVDTTHNELAVLRQGDVVLTDFNTFYSHSVDETLNFAKDLLLSKQNLFNKKAIIFALQANMGVGKTHFTKGIAQALNIHETVTSPSYSLEEDYDFQVDGFSNKLIHIDTWRMMAKEEFEELDLKKHIQDKNIIVIEWAEKVYPFIQSYQNDSYIIWLKMNIDKDDTRKILYSDTFVI